MFGCPAVESWVHLDDDREKSGFQADTRVEGLYSDHDGSGVEDMLAEAARDSDLDGEAAAMHNRYTQSQTYKVTRQCAPAAAS